MKEQNKISEKLSQMEKSNLPNKELKVMTIKKLIELGKRIDEYSERLNKKLENIKNNQTEVKFTIIERKDNTLGRVDYINQKNRSAN